MRFVRAYTDVATGELVRVSEREIPFEDDEPAPHALFVLPDGSRKIVPFQTHELGLAEHFDPTHAVTGGACSPAMHLFQRLEHLPDVKLSEGDPVMARFRAKPGFEADIPIFHHVPTTASGILRLARSKGPAAVHERVAAWLEFMGVLEHHELEAAGLPEMSLSLALEIDAMRVRRDPSVGSHAERLKREARQRIADRAALRLHASAAQAARAARDVAE